MEKNQTPELPQKLTLENRRRLQLSGVTEVESFDETTVALQTNQGLLVVRGAGLRLLQLSVDGGQVAVEGQIDAMIYEEGRREGGFFARLLR